jgi:F-type H+-transporting ATPase subunit a
MLNLPDLSKFVMAAGQTGDEGGEHAAHELPNFLTILYTKLVGTTFGEFIHKWEGVIFSLLTVAFIVTIVRLAIRNPKMIPSGLQNVVEMVVEGLEGFIVGVIGPEGKRFVPFLGTLFLYIYFMNISGLIPFLKSPTASLNQTLALALCVFFYVQYTGIKGLGIKGYVDHLLGTPRNVIQWALVPLMLPIHVIGELAKPMSLSLRLFGNVTGEDILILIFVGLGASIMSFTNLPIGIPLQLPFIFLALLTSLIQALVFMLLSTIYFAMMLPHTEDEHH